ncbi:MAG: DMT family transporter [Simkaniaceae bacterium]|nr:DMT family transporter [Simkaniaceae bacterium]
MENSQSKSFYLLLLWISIFIFAASNSVISKIGKLGAMHLVDGRNPISFCNVLFWANLIGGVVLLCVYCKSWSKESLSKVSATEWVHMFILAILSGVIGPTLFFLGLMLTEVINVVLISTLDIPMTIFFGWLIVKDKLSFGSCIAGLIALCGILLTFFLTQLNAMPMEMKMKMINIGDGPVAHLLATAPKSGEICIALAQLFIVFSVAYSRRVLKSVDTGIFSPFRMIVGAVIFFVIVLIMLGWVHFIDILNPYLIGWMLFYGGIVIALGLFLWYWGIKGTSGGDLAVANSFSPVAGVFFAFIILGEIPTMPQVIGGIVILVGIAVGLIATLREQRAASLVSATALCQTCKEGKSHEDGENRAQ